MSALAELKWRWLDGWRENPWRARCGGCGWPILWAWHKTPTGQECRNCQPQLSGAAATVPAMPRKNSNAGRERTTPPPLPSDLTRSKPGAGRSNEPRRETASNPPKGRERR